MAPGATCRVCRRWKPTAEFHRSNPSRWSTGGMSSRCKACDRECARRYREANRERCREASRRRRAMIIPADRETAAWRVVVGADPCSYCGKPGGTIDHVEPIIHGGQNVIDNLAGSCRACNARKGSKRLLPFLLEVL